MCTAIAFTATAHYFGRNLDLEHSYGEGVVITPRQYPLSFRRLPALTRHYAIIGMAAVREGYPLYFDGTNEHGLSMAGLNFPASARYLPAREGADNVASFECIPWILGRCRTLREAREQLRTLRLTNDSFSEALPVSPLHWLIADPTGAIAVEPMADGLHIHEDRVGVLTNEPPFEMQMNRLADYRALSPAQPPQRLMPGAELPLYSKGMGGIGLPGDLSSSSRFVRAVFLKGNARTGDTEEERVGQFFHILSGVEQLRGCTRTPEGDEFTRYTSCCNTERGIYYYTTYTNRRITAVDLRREDMDAAGLIVYPQETREQIHRQN